MTSVEIENPVIPTESVPQMYIKLSPEAPRPKNKWEYSPVGNSKALSFYFPTAPNAFHRWMQHLILGVTWERIKDDNPQ